MSPGVVTRPDEVVEVVIHSPATCDAVTLKLWELDVFVDPKTGERRDEGSQDDLLAEFEGRIAPGEGDRDSTDWRRFVVENHRIVSDDPLLVRCKLRFPGRDTVYEIPILSEAHEAEGSTYELGFSLHHGGEERFKTRVPCLFRAPAHELRVLQRISSLVDEEEEPWGVGVDELVLENRHALVCALQEKEQTCRVLCRAWLDEDGYLVRPPAEEGAASPALPLRSDRPLLLYTSEEPIEEGFVPALYQCDPIEVDPEQGVMFIDTADFEDPTALYLPEAELSYEADPDAEGDEDDEDDPGLWSLSFEPGEAREHPIDPQAEPAPWFEADAAEPDPPTGQEEDEHDLFRPPWEEDDDDESFDDEEFEYAFEEFELDMAEAGEEE